MKTKLWNPWNGNGILEAQESNSKLWMDEFYFI